MLLGIAALITISLSYVYVHYFMGIHLLLMCNLALGSTVNILVDKKTNQKNTCTDNLKY